MILPLVRVDFEYAFADTLFKFKLSLYLLKWKIIYFKTANKTSPSVMITYIFLDASSNITNKTSTDPFRVIPRYIIPKDLTHFKHKSQMDFPKELSVSHKLSLACKNH